MKTSNVFGESICFGVLLTGRDAITAKSRQVSSVPVIVGAFAQKNNVKGGEFCKRINIMAVRVEVGALSNQLTHYVVIL